MTPPKEQAGTVSFSFDSLPDQMLAVESSESLAAGWSDVSYHIGTGTPIDFSATATEGHRFFRVRALSRLSLGLSPNSPTLASGPVSLPDAAVGTEYAQLISPGWSGLPPYKIEAVGTPPAGFTLTVRSNQTGLAAVAVQSSGAGPAAGQRFQFSVTVVDAQNQTNTQVFDVRTVAPPPEIAAANLVLKAGEPAHLSLTAQGGHGALTWTVAGGTLPAGLALSADGLLTGTPTADAAESNEDGLHRVLLEVADSLPDRVTGAPSPRYASQEIPLLVRLSYRLNIRATRANGPSLRQTCFVCHGSGFLPDVESESALALINVPSGSGAECGTDRPYVSPGDASDSLIYEKLLERSPCGERMPFGGPYLSEQRLTRLARWIRELTPADAD